MEVLYIYSTWVNFIGITHTSSRIM